MKNAFHCLMSLLLACQTGFLCRLAAGQSTVAAQVQHGGGAQKHWSPAAAVFWLEPVNSGTVEHLAWPTQPPYRVVQKNKMFSPHVLVIPVGATVSFPNADPYFHNVFSLFDGKRFDLGLYETGSSREIRFERPGISYLFCNIHPEMSAVIVALRTPLWGTAEMDGKLRILNVPAGEYQAHLWVEGEDEGRLSAWTHSVLVSAHGDADAGRFATKATAPPPHQNKFGKPYKAEPQPY